MNYSDAITAVNTGTKCAYLTTWPSPVSIVLWTDSKIHVVAQDDLGVFSPTEEQENATNWATAPYDGDLPPR